MRILLTLVFSCSFLACFNPPQKVSTATSHELWTGDPQQLRHWKMAGPGSFVHDGDTVYAQGGMGLYWYSGREFKDFELELEWQVEDVANNSGVFVRFPDPNNDPWIAVNHGYEIQICDTPAPKHNTGSIYSFKAATHIPTKEAGEWNKYRIRVVGQQYTIYINDELVNEFVGDRSEQGYIGMQNHDDASP
ncbi:MAG: DUF1080 domain-containing protein, partial [Planctomycetota bacterium]|nr:DUF1080 domain-containing protein [Planctomycetota bacterium]